MKKIAILAIMLSGIAVSGCGPSPEDLAAQFQAAINSQDTEAALSLFADAATLQVGGAPHRTGKGEIEDWIREQADLNFQFTGDPVRSETRIVFTDCSISSYGWSFFGLDTMTGTCDVTLDDGAISSFSVQFDTESMEKLSGSPAATSADLIGTWVTLNYIGDSGDMFLEISGDGTGRLLGSRDASFPTPDSEFESANITWTYEETILTIQNDGPASEKYCEEQDVGTYLVKMVDGGGLKFKSIGDSCSLREVAFELPPRWRPYVP